MKSTCFRSQPRLICVFALIFVLRFSVQGQTDAPLEAERIFDSMHASVLALQSKHGNKDKTLAATLREISEQIRHLQRTANARPDIPRPQIYLESLNSIADLLKSLVDNQVTDKQLKKTINEVASDLAMKVAFTKGSRGDSFQLVEILVHTLKSSRDEVSGYEIWYVPKGWADYPGTEKHKRFHRLSSPSVMKLAPGNYLIWAVKEGPASERIPVTLGGDGASKNRVQLSVK